MATHIVNYDLPPSDDSSEQSRKRKNRNKSDDGNKNTTNGSSKNRKKAKRSSNSNDNALPSSLPGQQKIVIPRSEDDMRRSSSNKQSIKNDINRLYDEWNETPSLSRPHNFQHFIKNTFSLNHIQGDISVPEFETSFNEYQTFILDMYKDGVMCGLLTDGLSSLLEFPLDPEHVEYTGKISLILGKLHSTKQIFAHYTRLQQKKPLKKEATQPLKDYFNTFYDFSIDNTPTLPPKVIIYSYVQKKFYEEGLKRYRDTKNTYLYRQVYNKNNEATMGWEIMTRHGCPENTPITFEEYIHMKCGNAIAIQNNIVCDAYKNIFSGEVSSMAGKMENSYEIEFKDLLLNKKVFSFENGAYIIDMNHFSRRPVGRDDPEFFNSLKDGFVHYMSGDIHLSKNYEGERKGNPDLFDSIHDYAACNHLEGVMFPMDYFNTSLDKWKEIPTPYFDSIFKYQGLDDNVIHWIYMFLGRLFYYVGELDDYQIFPFFKGKAGTGKSLVLKILSTIFGEKNVGTMGDSMEDTYGFGRSAKRYIFMVPEASKNIKMTQETFQSMVSGDNVYISTKFVDGDMIPWRIPGIGCGNKYFPFFDKTGNIDRRFIYIQFNEVYQGADDRAENFRENINRELGYVLLKMNRAYLSLIKSDKNNTKITMAEGFPEYFKKTSMEAYAEINAIPGYLSFCLKEGIYERIPQGEVLFSEFKNSFNQYIREHRPHLRNLDFLEEDFQYTFDKYGLSFGKNDRREPVIVGIQKCTHQE